MHLCTMRVGCMHGRVWRQKGKRPDLRGWKLKPNAHAGSYPPFSIPPILLLGPYTYFQSLLFGLQVRGSFTISKWNIGSTTSKLNIGSSTFRIYLTLGSLNPSPGGPPVAIKRIWSVPLHVMDQLSCSSPQQPVYRLSTSSAHAGIYLERDLLGLGGVRCV